MGSSYSCAELSSSGIREGVSAKRTWRDCHSSRDISMSVSEPTDRWFPVPCCPARELPSLAACGTSGGASPTSRFGIRGMRGIAPPELERSDWEPRVDPLPSCPGWGTCGRTFPIPERSKASDRGLPESPDEMGVECAVMKMSGESYTLKSGAEPDFRWASAESCSGLEDA